MGEDLLMQCHTTSRFGHGRGDIAATMYSRVDDTASGSIRDFNSFSVELLDGNNLIRGLQCQLE